MNRWTLVFVLLSANATAQIPLDSPQRHIGPSASPCKSIEGFDPHDRVRYMPREYNIGDAAKPTRCIEWIDKHQGHCQITTECGET